MPKEEFEMTDLALTQAIERYREMEPELVEDAINCEWPEQIAVLLTELLFKSTCGTDEFFPEFIQMQRLDAESNYLIPICSCDLNEWRSK